MSKEDILELPVRELTAKAKSGDLTVIDIVDAYIQKIEQVNSSINAIIVPMFDEARQQAHAADELRQSGAKLPPLFGVPMTIKDSLDIGGFCILPGSRGTLLSLSVRFCKFRGRKCKPHRA